MTDNTPSPSVQPVRAWAVVDKDDAIIISAISAHKDFVEICVEKFKTLFPDNAPHRVIRVEIREANDE